MHACTRTSFEHLDRCWARQSKSDLRCTRVAPQVTAIGNVDEQTASRAQVVVGDRTVARTGVGVNGLLGILGPAYPDTS